MGDVVRFSKTGAGQAEPGRRALSDAEKRDERAERGRELKSRLDEKLRTSRKWKLTPEDTLIVSTAMWHLMERAAKRGVAKAKIMRDARIGSDADSTKHLGAYTTNPHTEAVDTSRRKKTRTLDRYMNLIKAASPLLEEEVAILIMDLFEQTSLMGPESAVRAADEYEQLAQRLRDVAAALDAKHGLKAYFEAERTQKLSLGVSNESRNEEDPAKMILEFLESTAILDWPMQPYKTNQDRYHDDYGDVPPYPAVIIGEFCADIFDIQVESDISPIDGATGPAVNKIRGSYYFDLRLCIVPMGSDMQPTAALRVCTRVEVFPLKQKKPIPERPGRFEDVDLMSFDDQLFLTPEVHSITGHSKNISQYIECQLLYETDGIPDHLKNYFRFHHFGRYSDAGHCQFFPVTGKVLADWLILRSFDQIWRSSKQDDCIRVLGPPIVPEFPDDLVLTEFPFDTIAAWVDSSFVGGGAVDALELLDSRSAFLVESFNEMVVEAKERRAGQVQAFEARLTKMSRTKG